MNKYKVKASEKSFYENVVEANSQDEAEDMIFSCDVDITKGRECSTDPEFKQEEKRWIESIEEIKQ